MSYIDVSPKIAPRLGVHDVAVVFVEEPTCPHALLLHGGGPGGERWGHTTECATCQW